MSEHTRQWYRVGRDEIRERRKDRIGERDRHICSLTDGSRTPHENDADANLIIAAPELLAACRAALADIGINVFGESCNPEFEAQLSAVIAKAEAKP